MCCNAGISGSSGGEEHKHRVVTARSIFVAIVMGAEALHFDVEVVPTVLFAADKDLEQSGKLCCSLFRLDRNVTVCGADDCFYACGFISVCEIVFNELIGCGDGDRTDLVKGKHAEPELVMTLEHEHYGVALLDAERFEIIRSLCRIFLHIAKGESAVGLIVCDPHHCELIGILFRNRIDAVKCKVEFVVVFEGDTVEDAVFVIVGFDEVVGDGCSLGSFGFGVLCGNVGYFGVFLGDKAILRVENNRVEFASALAYRDHTVGNEGIIEYRVALVQNINVVADLNLERTLDDNVEFLAVVRAELDGCVLLLGDIGEFNKEGLGELFLEFRREVIVLVAVLF